MANLTRRLMAACLALIAFFAVSMPADAATGGKRVALVIGNSGYQHTSQLKNPAQDAAGMAHALTRLGFDVIKGIDLDISAMRETIRDFSSKIEGADVALFYFAGHALQIDGKNQLAPVNAKLSRENDVDFETIPLNFVLRQMEREKRTNLVFLDACRDNPLATRLERSIRGRSSASVERGLARVESGVGTLIGYSTSPGMVALDGSGNNSPYTKALLAHIETPGITINDMMIAVRQDVLAESSGKQIPWEHSSLTGQFYFKEAAKVAAVVAKPEPQTAAPTVQRNLEEQKFVASSYQAAVAVGTCGAYRAFEEQHRGSYYGRLAEEWLKANCDSKRAISVESSGPADQAQAPAVLPPSSAGDGKEPVQVATAPTIAPPFVAAGTGAAKAPVQIAAAPPIAQTPADQPVQGEKPAINLVLEIQKELDRVGCNPGPPDGHWGGRTRNALQAFVIQTKAKFAFAEPSDIAYAAIKAHQGNACVVAVAPAPVKQVISGPPPVVHRASPPPRKEKIDEYWGGEDTRIDCEIHGIMSACMKKQR